MIRPKFRFLPVNPLGPKSMLVILLCAGLFMPHLAISAQANDASEPPVQGTGVLDLLEGDTLEAWKAPSTLWRIDQNVIIGSTGPTKLDLPEWIYTRQQFADFEFTCEIRLTGDDRRNSGIYFRAQPFQFKGYKSFEAPAGYEFDAAQAKSGKNNFWGSLGDWYARPKLRIFADQAIIGQAYQPGDWNRLTLRARGNRFEYWINGVKVMDYLDADPNGSREGFIGFQIHDGSVMQVEYKTIRVLPL